MPTVLEPRPTTSGIPSSSVPRRSSIGLIVAIVIALGLVLTRVISSVVVPAGVLPNRVQDGLTLGMSVLIESLPFVILGIVISIAVRIWLPDGVFIRVLPRSPWARRIVISFVGMLLPVCECGNVPLARGLMVRGLTVAESMTFLFAAPILNPITVITTAQAFGWSGGILVARIAGGFFIANLLGWVFSRHPNPDSLLTPRFAAECRLPEHQEHGTRWARSIQLFSTEAANLLPALFVGSVAAAAVQTLVPRSILVALGTDPIWSVVAMIGLSFIISVCSTVDAFFILPFATTFLPGSITAFLVFGAMIDIRMIALLRTTFSTRTIIQLFAVILLATAALSWLVNLVS